MIRPVLILVCALGINSPALRACQQRTQSASMSIISIFKELRWELRHVQLRNYVGKNSLFPFLARREIKPAIRPNLPYEWINEDCPEPAQQH